MTEVTPSSRGVANNTTMFVFVYTGWGTGRSTISYKQAIIIHNKHPSTHFEDFLPKSVEVVRRNILSETINLFE